MDFRALSNAQKSVIGDILGGERVKQLIPGAEKIGRSPGVGQTGIDDLYKVDLPGVDYVVVEYKFGSSVLKQTKDGLQVLMLLPLLPVYTLWGVCHFTSKF